jgi:hypothetical protein
MSVGAGSPTSLEGRGNLNNPTDAPPRKWWREPTILVGVLGFLAAGITAFISYQATQATVRAQYVALAAGILQRPKPESKDDDDRDLRRWAVDLVNEISPVKLPRSLQDRLTNGDVHLSAAARDSTAGFGTLGFGTFVFPSNDDKAREAFDEAIKGWRERADKNPQKAEP